MDAGRIPFEYVERLNACLVGGDLAPLLALFAEHARVERYLWNEPPRVYVGLEQIEESMLRLPPVGGTFQITHVEVQGHTVHAWFITQNFAFPMRGTYRFELNQDGKIVALYVSAAYNPDNA